NYELRITNYELRITNYELRITNYELRIEEWFVISGSVIGIRGLLPTDPPTPLTHSLHSSLVTRHSLDSPPSLCYNPLLVCKKIDILAAARQVVGDDFREEPA